MATLRHQGTAAIYKHNRIVYLYLMPVRKQIAQSDWIFFITFACADWLLLITFSKSYEADFLLPIKFHQ
jgi:hypothetical protein